MLKESNIANSHLSAFFQPVSPMAKASAETSRTSLRFTVLAERAAYLCTELGNCNTYSFLNDATVGRGANDRRRSAIIFVSGM